MRCEWRKLSAGAVAPGEIVTLIGPGIGPDQASGAQLDSEGRVATSFGDVTVSIAGIAAPLLYVSKNQINAVVPFRGGRTGERADTGAPRVRRIGFLSQGGTRSSGRLHDR